MPCGTLRVSAASTTDDEKPVRGLPPSSGRTRCQAHHAGDPAGTPGCPASARTTAEGRRTPAPSPTRLRRPRATRSPAADSIAFSSSAVLPTPGSPRTTSTPLRPARAESSSRLSVARSGRRSSTVTEPHVIPDAQRNAAWQAHATGAQEERFADADSPMT